MQAYNVRPDGICENGPRLLEVLGMNALDRLSLIDRIGRALQARMSFSEIEAYLRHHDVDTTKPTSGVNSKWVFTKELLADEPEHLVLRIADELEIPHSYAVSPRMEAVEAAFWEPLHFRLFLSHLATFKKTTAQLQVALRRFGISGFVAHVDIEPTREWQDEIEAGLASMHAMAAILMPGFKESNWTDQEVGFAVGRGVLVIPVIRGQNPYGFISKYQGLHSVGKSVGQVAHEIFEILVRSPRTRITMLTALVDTTVQSAHEEEALEKLRHLRAVPDLPTTLLDRLREGAPASLAFKPGPALDSLNSLLEERGLTKVAALDTDAVLPEEDLPF